MSKNDPLCALGASTHVAARARLTRLQRQEINRQAHVSAQVFERRERERLTQLALEQLEGEREKLDVDPDRTALDPPYA